MIAHVLCPGPSVDLCQRGARWRRGLAAWLASQSAVPSALHLPALKLAGPSRDVSYVGMQERDCSLVPGPKSRLPVAGCQHQHA